MSLWVKNGTIYLDDEESKDIPDGQYLSLEEYGKTYGVKPATLRVWIKRGQIRSIKLSRDRYIAVGEVPHKRRLSL